MQHEKIIQRPTGETFRVVVSFYLRNSTQHWTFRAAKSERYAQRIEPTPEEVHQTKIELWEKLKPLP